MLKFDNDNDFSLVDIYYIDTNNSIVWEYTDNENVKHQGFINEEFAVPREVEIGVDENNDPIVEIQQVNVFDRLQELIAQNIVFLTPSPLEPEKIKAKKTVDSVRDVLISSGIEYNGHKYQTDKDSIIDVMGAIIANMPVTWLTADNIEVTMTSTELQGLGAAIAQNKASLVYQARIHKNNIENLTTVESVRNYIDTITWV